jgi:outer membrane protein assembly factor BamB
MKTQVTTRQANVVAVQPLTKLFENRMSSFPRGCKVLSWVLALFAVLVSASVSRGQCPNPALEPNICLSPNGGVNACQSRAYRSDWNLDGGPIYSANLQEKYVDENQGNCLRLKFTKPTGNRNPLSIYGLGPSSSPAVDTSLILTPGSDASGYWGMYAYDVKTGSLVWDTISKGHPAGNAIRSSAQVFGFVFFGDEDGIFYSFDRTGNFRWEFSTDGPIDASATFPFSENHVYVVTASGSLYGFNAFDGSMVWPKVNTGVYPGGSGLGSNSASASSVSGKGLLFVAGSANLLTGTGVVKAFNPIDGSLVWSNPTVSGGPVTSSAVVGIGTGLVYVQSTVVCAASCNGALINALDGDLGSVVWNAPPLQPARLQQQPPPLPCLGVDIYQGGGSPAHDFHNNLLIAVTSHYRELSNCSTAFLGSRLIAYDAENGAIKWNVGINHAISQSSPTFSTGVVYVGTDDGYVLGFDEQTGTQIWNSFDTLGQTTGAVISPPVFGFNRIHWNDANGQLWVVGMPGY